MLNKMRINDVVILIKDYKSCPAAKTIPEGSIGVVHQVDEDYAEVVVKLNASRLKEIPIKLLRPMDLDLSEVNLELDNLRHDEFLFN